MASLCGGPLPSSTATPSVAATLPSSTPSPGPGGQCPPSGLYCSESPAERACQASVVQSGGAPSKCTASYVLCDPATGLALLEDPQPVAPGTACANNSVVYQSDPWCAATGFWCGPPLSPTSTPASLTVSPSNPPSASVAPSFVPTLSCPYPVDGPVCGPGPCAVTYHYCTRGLPGVVQPVATGTACVNFTAGGYSAMVSLVDAGCASRSSTPVPTATPAIIVSGAPSGSAAPGDGYYCAADGPEQASRAVLAQEGYLPSPCFLSFYRAWSGVVGPLQAVAPGTACYDGTFIFVTDPVCGVTCLPTGTPSSGYTPPPSATPSVSGGGEWGE